MALWTHIHQHDGVPGVRRILGDLALAMNSVERGELGAPVMADARLSETIHVPTEMLAWGGRSGAEWFLFPHTMDVVRWLFGRDPVEVHAKGHRGVLDGMGIHCWDAMQALVEFEARRSAPSRPPGSSPTATPTSSTTGCRSYGDKGGLELRNEPALWAFTDRFHTPFSSTSVTRYGKVWGFQYESIRYFIDCVADDGVPEAGGRDGLMVPALIEATLRSLAGRRPVRVADVLDADRAGG